MCVVVLCVFVVFFFPVFSFFSYPYSAVLCLQLKSGYSSTGSSGGLPGGQITLNIQKVSIHGKHGIVIHLVEHSYTAGKAVFLHKAHFSYNTSLFSS